MAKAAKTSLEHKYLRKRDYFAIICPRLPSTFKFLTKIAKNKLVELPLNYIQRMRDLPSCFHVVVKISVLEISRCCFADYAS